MERSATAGELLHRARVAAGTHNVREAVRELTLHALRGRPLTAPHIAAVARTVGEGIASCDVPPTAPVRDTSRGAWAGLEDAIGEALHAFELALKEVAQGRACLAVPERETMREQIGQLALSLGKDWGHLRALPPSLSARIAALEELLRQDGRGVDF